jgi:hypothetical protein
VPDERLHVYGVVPPVAASIAEYEAAAVPAGKLVVVMLSRAATLTVKLWVAVWGVSSESATCTVKE